MSASITPDFDAFAGPDAPYPRERLSSILWLLAWPVVALNLLQTFNNLLDRGFIGHLSDSSLTAFGGSMNIIFVTFSIALALAVGSSAVVSRAFGARDMDRVRVGASHATRLSLVVGILVGALGVVTALPVARAILPSSDPEAIRLMALYLKIDSLNLPAAFLIQSLAGSLRGIGDSRSPMVLSSIQIFFHVLLNFLLVLPSRSIGPFHVYGAGLGLEGSAIALTVSTILCGIGYYAYSSRTPLGRAGIHRLPSLAWSRRILRVASPAAAMMLLRSLSLTAFTTVLGATPGGDVAIGAMSVAFAIETLIYMPALGIGSAAGALVGNSLGMGQPKRAERIGLIASLHGTLITLVLAGIVFLSAHFLSSLLIAGKPDYLAQSVLLLRWLCGTEALLGLSMVVFGAMQGAGETVGPMWISTICMWGIRIPMALVLSLKSGSPLLFAVTLPVGFGLGAVGSWAAMSITQGLQGIMAFGLFKAGRWKTKEV